MSLLPTECLVGVFITAALRITASRVDASFMAGVKQNWQMCQHAFKLRQITNKHSTQWAGKVGKRQGWSEIFELRFINFRPGVHFIYSCTVLKLSQSFGSRAGRFDKIGKHISMDKICQNCISFFKASALWADAFIELWCQYICLSVCPLFMLFFSRPLIGPQVTWSIQGLWLVNPPSLPNWAPPSPHCEVVTRQWI